jgi:hypothetical protein
MCLVVALTHIGAFLLVSRKPFLLVGPMVLGIFAIARVRLTRMGDQQKARLLFGNGVITVFAIFYVGGLPLACSNSMVDELGLMEVGSIAATWVMLLIFFRLSAVQNTQRVRDTAF